MKSLICTTPGQLDYAELVMPEQLQGAAVIKIKRIGICGTDLHAFEGTQPFFSYPRVLGHELSGELVDAGDAEGFVKGETVTFIPYFNCGHCIACRRGLPNCCVNIKVFGVHVDGGMAEYVSVPADKLVHGEGLSYDELALVEPLAIGAHAIRRAAVDEGELVVVVGAGPIGLGTMEFARIAGAQVIAIDVNAERLAFCKNKLQVAHTINAATGNAVEEVREITGGDMATVVIDATGNLRAINSGINYLAHGGRYVLVGLQKQEFSFSHPEFHKRESTLMSSRNATRADFEHVIASMKKGLVDPKTYITHRVAFHQVKGAFESWLNPANGVIKAMVSLED
jgi:2-desacetyl-2-hydroxyethyl bacteriochlorophyllide A dehydrogenase